MTSGEASNIEGTFRFGFLSCLTLQVIKALVHTAPSGITGLLPVPGPPCRQDALGSSGHVAPAPGLWAGLTLRPQHPRPALSPSIVTGKPPDTAVWNHAS